MQSYHVSTFCKIFFPLKLVVNLLALTHSHTGDIYTKPTFESQHERSKVVCWKLNFHLKELLCQT